MAVTWQYILVPLRNAGRMRKDSGAVAQDELDALGGQGWEAVGMSLKHGALDAWPVVLMKRQVS